jgi:hypothetical protein
VSSIEERLDRIEALLKVLVGNSSGHSQDQAEAEFQILLDLKKSLPPDEYALEHGRIMSQRLIREGRPQEAARWLRNSQRKADRLRRATA